MADSTRIAIEKLNGSNYQIWKYKLELLLIKEDLWDLIVQPKPDDPDDKWIKRDGRARATIGLLVEDNQLTHVRKHTTARDAWNSLREYHEKSTLTNRVSMLKRLCNARLVDGGSMEDHIDTILDLVDKLSALGETLQEHLVVAFILSSLPDSYGTMITALETRPEQDLTLELVKGKLIDEYRRRKESASHNQKVALKVNYISDTRDAITSAKGSHDNRITDSSAKQSGENVCYYCKKPGHFKRECRKMRADRSKQRYNASHRANKVTGDEHTIKEGNGAHICFSTTKIHEGHWYVDSGASCHMTSDRNFFTDLNESHKDTVGLANGNKLVTAGIGQGTITALTRDGTANVILIKGVLYVPDLDGSLLSVCAIASQGLCVTFEGLECRITKNGNIIATANSKGQLYELNCSNTALKVTNAVNHGETLHTWHRRFGHRDTEAIKQIESKGLVAGIYLRDQEVTKICESCVKGKLTRKPFDKKTGGLAMSTLDLIHTDICGPMQTLTPGGKRYFLTLIDDHSRFTMTFLLSNKSEAPAIIRDYIELVKTQFHRTPKAIRSDRGGEYMGDALKVYLRTQGIRHQTTTPYTPQQNGVAERKNRSLCEMARCMLNDGNLPNRYWGEAINTATYIQNRLCTRACTKTPYEGFYGKRPNVSHMRVFGCDAYMHIPQERRRKLDDKAVRYRFVGYEHGTKGYRLLDVDTNQIHISRDVVFNEEKNTIVHTIQPPELRQSKCATSIDIVDGGEPQSAADTETVERIDTDQDAETDSQPVPRVSLRANKGQLPIRYAYTAATKYIPEPRNLTEAFSSPNKREWVAAMDEEIKSLHENNAWELVPLPAHCSAIGCKWTFKAKLDQDGNVNRYKARLVAQGFSQKYGVDYDEVYAPVIKQTTLRTLLAVAGKTNMDVQHLDIKTAFLYGDLDEIIYMRQPEGYEDDQEKGLVCRLRKSIYGLKQAARVWNGKLNDVLLKGRYTRSTIDPCLYFKNVNGVRIYTLVYVDDLIIISEDVKLIQETEGLLKKVFQVSNLGNLSFYLGMQFDRDEKGVFHMHQTSYIHKLLSRFKLDDAKPSNVPLDPGYFKHDNGKLLPNNNNYRQAIGALLYIAINTRPDILCSVSILSRKTSAPTQTDWTEVKRIFRYLRSTVGERLLLGHHEGSKTDDLLGYADADWANDPSSRKSNSGHIFTYQGATISWGCRKQSCVALSSTEAEYVSLSEACREASWLRKLLKELNLQFSETTLIFEDNQSCLKLLDSGKVNARTKHIDVMVHYVKELQDKGEVRVQYCPTEGMMADLMTKPLGNVKLKTLKRLIGLCGLSHMPLH